MKTGYSGNPADGIPAPGDCESGGVYQGRVGLQQRVLPSYRAAFMEHFAETCPGGLGVFAGEPRPDESILSAADLESAVFTPADNRHFLRGRAYLCRQPGILAWLEEWDPDVLILEANPRYPDNRRAQRWMHSRSRSVIGWGLGAVPVSGPAGVLRKAARRGYLAGFDALITYSTQGAAMYHAEGIPLERIFVAHNAVVSRKSASRERLQREEVPVVLFVGRLQARKRVDALIEACAAVDLEKQLWVVGDGPERGNLEALAAERLPDARFFGAMQGPELDRLFRTADLFVLPGTGGLAVQEAMGAGLPVIAAEGDGTQQDLVTMENGWLLPPGDAAALKEALADALSDRGRLLLMGERSRERVRQSVNIESMAEVFHRAMCAVTGTEKQDEAGICR